MKRKDQSAHNPEEKDAWKRVRLGKEGRKRRRAGEGRGTSEYLRELWAAQVVLVRADLQRILTKMFAWAFFTTNSSLQLPKDFSVSS